MFLAEGRALGRAEGKQRLLLSQAAAKFGPADPAAAARVRAVTDPDELDRLGLRLLATDTWAAWLDG